MKNLNINTMGQLLGLIGVMASLIFVGMELRQSQTIALAGQIQAMNQCAVPKAFDWNSCSISLRNWSLTQIFNCHRARKLAGCILSNT